MRLFESIRKAFPLVIAVGIPGVALNAQENRIAVDREGSTIVLESYASDIVRVTISTLNDQAIAAPGYEIVAKPLPAGWTH